MSDRSSLARALREAGVPAGHYVIEGIHEPAPTPPDFVYLRALSGGDWDVGIYERGAHHSVARYSTEAAACDRLWRLLGLEGRPPDGRA